MEPLEIIILIAAISLVIFTVIFNIVRKRKGKNSCCSDCQSCKKYGDCCEVKNRQSNRH